MNHRKNILAVLEGRSPERIPWSPRLEIWYKAHKSMGTLPEKYSGWSLREIERDLGVATPARAGKVFSTRIRNVDIREQRQESTVMREYVTPVGKVTSLNRQSEDLARIGIIGLDLEYMIKGPEDYPIVEYIVEHSDVIPCYEEYLLYDDEIGDEGLPMVHLGQDPMDQILQELIGYNNAYYHLYDYRNLVLHLYEVLKEYAEKVQKVVLDSPARLVVQGEHFDSMMTPPKIFSDYMIPYFQPFAEQLKERGKVLGCHGDADTSKLLPLIKEAGFGLVECFVTAPMVPVTLREARNVFGNDVIIWGGIPSTILCDPVSDKEFEEYMVNLFQDISPGDAFILGVADNVMPEAKLIRIIKVSEMVAEYGQYPIRIN
jgi:hypothetical protein